MTDREQTRRDIEKWLPPDNESTARRKLATVFAELEQAVIERDLRRERKVALAETEARLAEVPALVEALKTIKLHSLLNVRRAAFAPTIGVRYTETIRAEIADELRKLEDFVDKTLDTWEQK